MQVQKLSISLALAIATAANLTSASHASTKYDAILQQLGLKPTQTEITQPQTTQSQVIKSQAIQPQATQTQSQKSLSTDQVGRTFFSHPPTLIRAASSQIGVSIPSTYEFTLTVPQDARQPLKAVTITQAGNAETINFDANNSKAFTGRKLTVNSEIRLASVGGAQPANSGEATIVFDQPVQPGNTVTIALAAQRNPNWGGIYLFGVTAYPDGENGLGQFLGYGRIHFYSNSK
jgi:hypothetical protein